ncbi:LysR family transcriptional regulator [Pseudovibrio sp. Tun.PSC04-5.I4]|uniref:LysR family transcriptional regulator n=1 Tax=Pseudovibrio sp. Tun.PSC04-5.I4 TaxID=1798213 RepID=UPI000890F0B3|nr:LysR family transcriptional regulator [Pseudovibrio sp. Tun.PSC04-5.I4]SDQ12687.1 DNA-binding transcriptional regulator, LysR family [Pseudovibrio sp. Tun.PSC04-5.I4]
MMENIDINGKLISINGKSSSNDLVWDDTKAFLAVARTGTLSAAAQFLTIGVATLSRKIDRLEATLKIPLFVRHQSGYQLTEDGKELLEKAEVMEVAALALVSGANAQAGVFGKVRLATAENLATSLILPSLPEFHARYPDLVIEIITDINTVNLHRRDADLAIRMIKPERGNVSLKRLGTLGYGLYASLEYTLKHKELAELGSYENDVFIAWCEAQSHLPAAQWIERVLRGRQPAVLTSSLATQLAATKAGLGLAVLPHFLATDAGLVCLDSDVGVDQPIYLVVQSDLAQSRRTRAVADFLSDLVIKNRAKLSGPQR